MAGRGPLATTSRSAPLICIIGRRGQGPCDGPLPVGGTQCSRAPPCIANGWCGPVMRKRRGLQFTMPVEVDWSRNDTDLLGRFWDQHQGQQEASAEISDRILVFHRGIDTVRPPHPSDPGPDARGTGHLPCYSACKQGVSMVVSCILLGMEAGQVETGCQIAPLFSRQSAAIRVSDAVSSQVICCCTFVAMT